MSLSKSSEMSYNNQIHSTLNLVADPNNNQSPDNQLNEFDPLEELEIPPGPVSHVRIKKVQKDSHKKVQKVLDGDTMQSANDVLMKLPEKRRDEMLRDLSENEAKQLNTLLSHLYRANDPEMFAEIISTIKCGRKPLHSSK